MPFKDMAQKRKRRKRMKKLKAIICMITAAVMSFAVVGVAGCGHSHTFSDTWETTETEHWKAATCEHTEEKGEYGTHTFDSNFVCTVCGYKHSHKYLTEWESDENGHWHNASCGHDTTRGYAIHRYNNDYLCTTCGYQHNHSYSQDWSHDADKHWHADTCSHNTVSAEAEHDWDENYVCRTCGYTMRNVGISVSKTVTDYTLSATTPTVNVPINDIKVNLARANESTVREISLSECTLEYYKGGQRIDNLNGLSGGAYNIWVKTNVEIDGAMKEVESFVIVYVIDTLQSLTCDRFATGSVFRQGKSVIDRISETWKFTATYASGATEDITASDLNITNFDTNNETAGANATATYTAYDSKGVATSKSTYVNYKIEASQNQVTTNSYSFDALKATIPADKQSEKTITLAAGALGGNEFATILGDNVAWYRGDGNYLLEIQNDALKVSLTGVGMITIGVSSTSSANISSIALKDSEGNYILGKSDSSNIEKDDDRNAYSIYGKDGIIKFIILNPGEYTICTVEDITVEGDISDTNRHTRINSLEVVNEEVTNG